MTSPIKSLSNPSAQPPETPEISRETIRRCAELLAHGEIAWPVGLSPDQELILIADAREFRRARLVKFIAAQIARDIAKEIKNQREAPE